MNKHLLLSVAIVFSVWFNANAVTLSVDTPCTPDLGTGDGTDGMGNDASLILAGSYNLVNGDFTSYGNVTLLISSTGQNILNFHNFTLPDGDTFKINESAYQGPLIIKCTGSANINGKMDLAGRTAKDYCTSPRSGIGAVGGPCGGQQGGNGGSGQANGVSGVSFGNAGGGGGFGKYGAGQNGYGSGGGGGNYGGIATAGGKGDNSTGGTAGATYGSADFSVDLTQYPYTGPLCGGSGGGGGGGGYAGLNAYGAGGGGGGGAIMIVADSINIGTQLVAIAVNGGNGGSPGGYGPCTGQPPVGGGGGGGSGGSIVLRYLTSYINSFGTDDNLRYTGGIGGGGGSYKGGTGGAGHLLIGQFCGTPTGNQELSQTNGYTYVDLLSARNIHFVFNSSEGDSEIKLFDLTGRELRRMVFSGQHAIISCLDLSSGLYIYKCSAAGKVARAGRILIR